MNLHRAFSLRALVWLGAVTCLTSAAFAETTANKPNILVIFGDDIGWMNVSSYGGDVMGVATPNIDRIGKEGLRLDALSTPSRVAPPAARPSSPDNCRSAPA